MNAPEPQILATRALNALRRLHLPTYVATRFLCDNKVFRTASSWVNEVLPWKMAIKHSPKYWKQLQYKGLGDNGEIIYREFLIPSPTTAMAEALVLSYLANSEQFSKSDRVYSYMWPKSNTYGHSYLHYSEGYKKRNEDIQSHLNIYPQKVAVITDIEKFYPSINRARVEVGFLKALEESQIPSEIQTLCKKLLEQIWLPLTDDIGIATGPLLSHVIGDFALRNIDEILSNRFPNSYYRYVDDVVLLVSESEAKNIASYLEELFLKEGLKLNKIKTDYVSGEEWLSNGPHKYSKVKENSFESLIFFLKVFLSLHPNQKDRLNKLLEERGFRIPLDRLTTSGQSRKFKGMFKRLWRRGWWVAIQAIFSSVDDIIKKAADVRKSTYDELSTLLTRKPPQKSTLRRWWLQRTRYLVNRLIYLSPDKDLEFLVQPLSEIPEFIQHSALLKLLLKNEIDELAEMPGAALNAGVSLLRQEKREIPIVTKYDKNAPARIESASQIFLNRLNPNDLISIQGLNKSYSEYLAFCSAQPSSFRTNLDFSYLDEITCLALNKSTEDYLEALDKKFSDDEDEVFDALEIGEVYPFCG